MERDFSKEDIKGLKEFLLEIGEDPKDYTTKELMGMLENGFMSA